MTATEAAQKMAATRGYVIAGVARTNLVGPTAEYIGQFWPTWAGHPLEGYRLRVVGTTDRKDWNRQVLAIFGNKRFDANPAHGNVYFKCELVPDKGPK